MRRKRLTGRRWGILRERALRRAGWKCEKCGIPGLLEVHHVLPVARGGADSLDNLEVLCRNCHFRSVDHVTDPVRRAWKARVRNAY